MGRRKRPLDAQIENFIRMEARGEDHETVLIETFGAEVAADPVKRNAAESTIYRWRRRDDYQAIWDDEMKARVRRCVPRAVGRLEKQIDNENDWVANKAANDVVNLAKTTGIFQSEEKAINVQITGMPEIGSPDDEE